MTMTETDPGAAAGLATDRDEVIKLAILAVGGQGGGVITDWIVDVAERNGWYAQATSVPGVAQRTGATIYYVEMVREDEAGGTPVLALMPSPGDVDIVLAAEMMEAGRAIQRGFVTPDRTTLIASTDRTLAVIEKIVPGSGIAESDPVADAALAASRRFLSADLDRLAKQNGSVISASLFGALAGARVLPFAPDTFEETIKAGGRGIEASLRAFRAGAEAIGNPAAAASLTRSDVRSGDKGVVGPEKERRAWGGLLERIEREFPAAARPMLRAGLEKVVDFQDVGYGGEYLDRLKAQYDRDSASGGVEKGFRFTVESAKYVANAMAYDDVVRVADLKTRASRFRRIETQMGVGDRNVMHVTEFMHPRIEEVCGTMPAGLGNFIVTRPGLRRTLDRLVNRGRHVRTDTIRWFLALYFVGGLRRIRRRSLRHRTETAHLEDWLSLANATIPEDYDLAVEVIRCRRLIKGYSDTHARGESKFDRVLSALPVLKGRDDAAEWLHRLIEAALKDEKGEMLDGALKTIRTL
ncbi:indolepyruvate oxidoreductase subunit beta family protein [Microbaculum marinum]|uniref:Indolepyruvate oxidoreductase subunit beta family protein n=2 Tax=Microbaculum marinum TaxID=1764581 RepID=A0AAW9RPR5_9HYPH